MQCQSADVKAAVLTMIRKSSEIGSPVTPRAWKIAYDMVRAQAIADTLIWKHNHITITER